MTLIVARDREKLEAARRKPRAVGSTLITYAADIADAGAMRGADRRRSSQKPRRRRHSGQQRRPLDPARISNSYDRLHDFERMMQLNYFGGGAADAWRFLPGMCRKGDRPRDQHLLDRRAR